MGKLRTIARRTFLIGSAAIAGGVVFGVYAYQKPGKNPLLETLADGEATITPYIKITADGITLITPRADKGQGAYSLQAALIAEELDVDLDQVSVDPGPPSATYYNTALAAEAADFMIPAQGALNSMAKTGLDAAMKFIGLQITGGSTTAPDGYDKLRMAGAVARETIKKAAAKKSGIPVDQLKTLKGEVLLPDGSALSYTSLAGDLANVEAASNVTLREPSEWRILGKPMQRVDIVAKSTGTLTYGIDAKVDGMVHATVLLNPAQSGAINGFDATEAEKMRGVKKIVPVTGGVGIVANNTWRAFQAAQAIKADWAKASFPDTMEGHWKALADSFNADQQDSRHRDDGDVEQALSSGTVIEAEYRAPYLAHAPLEPISAIVLVTDNKAEVWTGTQIPRFVQNNVGKITGLDPEQVIVHVQYMGGSFGHRLEDEVVKQATEIAVQMKGTPVKLTYSREEDMTHDFVRQIAMARMKGTVKDGMVESYDLAIAMPSVVVSQMSRQGLGVPGPDSQIVAGAWEQPFAVPHHRVTGYRARELAPISSWRSVGASTNGFFYNLGLDELIHAAGADPLEERLRLASDDLTRTILSTVKEMSKWNGPALDADSAGNKRGRGVAVTKSFGVTVAEVIDVSHTASGIKIDNVWVAADVGKVLDPVNFDNLVKGGVVFALGHAMNCEITYTNGIADQTNYHTFEGMRMYQCPQIKVKGLETGSCVLGIGEPPVPPAAPALASAIFAATGIRIREMPFNKFIDFA